MSEGRTHEQFVLAAGPNVSIRLRRKSDADGEYRWRSDPETARFNGRAPVVEPFEHFQDLVSYELTYGMNDREQFSIETADGRHAGTIMLYNLSLDSAELGITIGPEELRGAGLGRESITTFLRWVWNNRPLRLVYLHVLEWNERAARCFQRAGFDVSGRVRRDDQSFIRMEVRREWWMLWDAEGRFQFERDSAGDRAMAAANTDAAPLAEG